MGGMRITEGRLVDRVCPHCGGIERRAFGESVSEAGELASYAFGWTTTHDDRHAAITIGIGAGNEGGGSFHATVFEQEDGYAMGLRDEPFEDVPEGGPDLTRDEALEHPDLKYVWWVADEAMQQDRRARWMLHWLFATPAAMALPVYDAREPARAVARDAAGDWRLLSGDEDAPFRRARLHEALDRDQSLLDVLDLEPGQRAERRKLLGGWKRGSY
jgi:hypothetical protein